MSASAPCGRKVHRISVAVDALEHNACRAVELHQAVFRWREVAADALQHCFDYSDRRHRLPPPAGCVQRGLFLAPTADLADIGLHVNVSASAPAVSLLRQTVLPAASSTVVATAGSSASTGTSAVTSNEPSPVVVAIGQYGRSHEPTAGLPAPRNGRCRDARSPVLGASWRTRIQSKPRLMY